MKKVHLLTTVAVSLLLAGTAAAQMKNQQPDRVPSAEQNAPAEKIAPSMHGGQRKPETTGQATKSDDKAKTNLKASDSGKAGMKNSDRDSAQTKPSAKKSETTGQAPKASESNKTEMNKSGAAKSELSKSNTNSNINGNAQTNSGTSQKSSGSLNDNASTTGQGVAAGVANLSTEQRTKITTILRQHKVEPTHLNVTVRVGTSVPASVHFYPLPTEVVEVYPEWRGYDYILVGDQIIIINPRNHLIVAILEA